MVVQLRLADDPDISDAEMDIWPSQATGSGGVGSLEESLLQAYTNPRATRANAYFFGETFIGFWVLEYQKEI